MGYFGGLWRPGYASDTGAVLELVWAWVPTRAYCICPRNISGYTALSRIFAQIHAIFDNTLVFSRPRTVIYNRSRVNCTQTSVYSARIAYNTQQPVDTLEQDYFPVRERLVVRASSIGSSVGLRLFLRLGSMSALFCR